MKKLLLIVLLICTSFVAFSGPVPLKKAQNVALSAYGKFVKDAHIKSFTVALDDSFKLVNGKPVDVPGLTSKKIVNHYIFNMDPKGFVMVSGDDGANPIIDISNESYWVDPSTSKDPGSKNIDFYHKKIKSVVHDIIVNKRKATDKISRAWGNFSGEKLTLTPLTFSTSITPLVHSIYNQEPIYNDSCPGGSVTGCVATCAQQIMRYWQWPNVGTGSFSYTGAYGTLKCDFNHAFNWSSMTLNLTSSTPADSAIPTEGSVFEIGVSVAMQYNPNGSGAYVLSTDAPGQPCMQNSYSQYFGYNPTTLAGCIKSNFSIGRWDSIINVELNNNRPIQYAGFGVDGGHTWVLDGYESIDSFYHMNWGWGGIDDGYFVLDNLNPEGIPLGSSDEMLIGIEPAGLTPCQTPTNFTLSNLTDTSVLLSWTPASGGSSINLEYQQIGAPGWTIKTGIIGSSYLFHGKQNGVYTGTSYQVAIQQLCTNSGASAYTNPQTFTTLGPTQCPTPTIQQVMASSYYAVVKFTPVVSATAYIAKWQLAGTKTWFSDTILAGTAYDTIPDAKNRANPLQANASYNFGIQSLCGSDTSTLSYWIPNQTWRYIYTYPPCGVATNLVADSTGWMNSKIAWTKVTNAAYYNVFIDNISTPGCYSGECYLINTFYNDTPNVFYACPIAEGSWRYEIITICTNGGGTVSNWGYFSTTPNYNVGTPTNLTATNLTSTSGLLTWSPSYNAQLYDFSLVSVNPFYQNMYEVPSNSALVTGLIPSSLYLSEASSISNKWGLSAWTPQYSWYTLPSGPVVCDTVTGIKFTNITSSAVTVSWTAATSDSVYNLQYKLSTSSTWSSIITTNTSYILSGLSSSTTYQVEIQSICSKTNTSGFTHIYSFTTSSPIVVSITSHINEICYGNSTGSATSTVAGGKSPYTYSWSPGGGSLTTASNLTAGTYTITVTDANSTQASASVIITQPTAISASTTIKNVSCNGGNNGSATVNVSGGTTPYIYSWNTSPSQTTSTATGLAAGTYTVTIFDANNCTKTATAVITQPSPLIASTTIKNVSCSGGNTGSSNVVVTGGTSPYTYSWNTTPVQTTSTATGLSAGTYNVTVKDANGCSTTSASIITQPSALTSSVTTTSNTATVTVSGGTSPYTYSWNTTPAQTTSTATGLSSGTTYTVTVKDAHGCTATSLAVTQGSITYCVAKGNTSLDYIKNVTIGSINNTTSNDGGYGNYTNLSTNIIPGQTYTISLTPGFKIPIPTPGPVNPIPIKPSPVNPQIINTHPTLMISTSSVLNDQYWSVFIDYKHNGTLTEVFKGNSTATVTGTFVIPTTAVLGPTRMRIIKHDGRTNATYVNNPCITSGYNDVQDYTVNITNIGLRAK